MSSNSKKLNVQIISYKEEFKHCFFNLNIEWLEKFFVVEPYDKEVLSQPEKYILNDGGCILFAKCEDQIVGTH